VWIGIAFNALFVVEMVLKLYAYGLQPYFSRRWNCYDCFVVRTALDIFSLSLHLSLCLSPSLSVSLSLFMFISSS